MKPFFTLALVLAATAAAHEIGATRVTAGLRDGRYVIEIVADAASLDEKLAAAGQPVESRIRIAFDGAAAMPALARDGGSIRLTGAIPAGAREFTWSYGWTFATYSLTVNGATQWLEGGQLSAPVGLATAAPAESTVFRYLVLGFTHIVPHGIDHVVFVLGLFLLSRSPRALLAQVTAFTAAHSITLGLSLYDVISLPPAVVEPLIAVSIAWIAVENICMRELRSSRVVLVFAFGLLHGLGFAGALRGIGLPRSEFLTALVSFNAGVEAGQLAVIAAAFLLVGWRCADRPWYRRRVVIPASATIACAAVYWTIERWP
jgi:hypothetical protein